MAVTNLFNSGSGILSEGISTITDTYADLVGILDPKTGRLIKAGLQPGGLPRNRRQIARAETQVVFSSNESYVERRVKISVGSNSGILYRNSDPGPILLPLQKTDGVIFPYTPKIATVFQSQYQDMDITHTNYSYQAYQRSTISSITIDAVFTAQTPWEAQYVMAVIHFFRAAGKMFMGPDAALAGNPPPLLFLNGYGTNYFPNVPCVLTQFSHSLPDDVDYISAPDVPASKYEEANRIVADPGASKSITTGGTLMATRVPTMSSIQVVLQPVYSREKVGKFSLEDFARGKYLNQGYI